MPKLSSAKTGETVAWKNSPRPGKAVPAEITQLKQEPGRNIIIYGSATLVQTLTSLNLIDQYQLLLHPLALGNGKPLFKDHARLKLVHSTTHPSGVIELYYQPREQQNGQ